MRLAKPWPDPYKVNARSPYGPRVHPITGKRSFHHGVDVAMPVGTPLTAPADGVVVHKNRTASAGFNLILRHEGTWHTVYYHLQKPSHLALGATVKTGDAIAFSGNTGASTGPHLHWELRTRTWGDTVDPLQYVVQEQTPAPVTEPVTPPTRPARFIPTPLSQSLPPSSKYGRG
jgi:murein DD-endopeptidase MepM/ murein hydrolase activator NlpD